MDGIYEAIGRLKDWSDENSNNNLLMVVRDIYQITVYTQNFTGFLLAGIMQRCPELRTLILDAMKIYEERNKQQ